MSYYCVLILYFGSVVAAVRLGEVGSLVVRVLFIVSTKVLEAGWRETQIGNRFPATEDVAIRPTTKAKIR